MKTGDYSYQLDHSLIAKLPPSVRGDARLLVLDKKSGTVIDDQYGNIVNWLNKGDLLVLNRTKVIKARLMAKKANGSERELVIVEKHGLADDWYQHKVLYRGSLNNGEILKIGKCKVRVVDILGEGLALINSHQNLLDVAEEFGEVPLPPYIHRQSTDDDTRRYQTVWAKYSGSVAAPTASLNMTISTLRKLQAKGVKLAYLTLHVGLGTFLPIRTDNLDDFQMHQEYFEIPLATVSAIKRNMNDYKPIVALGTTVCRCLEYNADEIYGQPAAKLSGEADIFIYPDYHFKIVDALITNFHAPDSTVLMMAGAFAGWSNLMSAYSHAIDRNYRFLSYGDSMLIK